MHFSLVLIGAHSGTKLAQLIADGRGAGNVLLVEPVPFLFRQLEEKFAGQPGVFLRNLCVGPTDGTARFVAPLPTANSVMIHGDQLGSLLPDHAVNHDPALAAHLETIEVASVTFDTLIEELDIGSIELLYCDTEGMDVTLLEMFPFEILRPLKIMFEFKHADGTFRIGRKLGRFLIQLDDMGYRAKVLDMENILAERIAAPVVKPVPGKVKRILGILFGD